MLQLQQAVTKLWQYAPVGVGSSQHKQVVAVAPAAQVWWPRLLL
jgi:hypothetical protein